MANLNANEQKVMNDICEAISKFNGQWTVTNLVDTNKYGNPQAFGAYMTILETKGLIEVEVDPDHDDLIELTDEGWGYFKNRS